MRGEATLAGECIEVPSFQVGGRFRGRPPQGDGSTTTRPSAAWVVFLDSPGRPASGDPRGGCGAAMGHRYPSCWCPRRRWGLVSFPAILSVLSVLSVRNPQEDNRVMSPHRRTTHPSPARRNGRPNAGTLQRSRSGGVGGRPAYQQRRGEQNPGWHTHTHRVGRCRAASHTCATRYTYTGQLPGSTARPDTTSSAADPRSSVPGTGYPIGAYPACVSRTAYPLRPLPATTHTLLPG